VKRNRSSVSSSGQHPKQPVVLQVLPRLQTGGVERGTVEMAGAIAKSGWRSLVASEGGGMLPLINYAGAEHITLPLASKNPWRIWRNAGLLEKIIQRYEVDIVHARSRAPAWSAMLAARRAGVHFVTTFHGIYGLEPDIKRRYNEVMTRGERVIAVSEFVSKHILQNYPIDPSKLRVIHRGVEPAQFNPARIMPQRMVELTSRWRLPDEVPLILLPGRITRWKGHHVLVEALARLPHRHFFCLMVGDDAQHPHYRQELEKQIFARGLEAHVRMAGNTPYMAEAYALADLVVAPSIEPEAFGRVPVEAQAMGRLVIAADHGGACETVTDGETGWLVRPDDPLALSRAIERALALPNEERERIGRQAMAQAQERFSSEAMCLKTLSVYWELIGSRYE
jgi:glycosyltransferase involved in cell wall biosynthesis